MPACQINALFPELSAEIGMVTIADISMDSRELAPGSLFVALQGEVSHGLAYAADAVRQGAVAVLWEPVEGQDGLRALADQLTVPCQPLEGLRARLSEVAASFFQARKRPLQIAGVTGTNGKTSVAFLVAQAVTSRFGACGLIRTLGYGLYGKIQSGSRTTPDLLSVHRSLGQISEQGAEHAAIEVSSHALKQGRVQGVNIDVAVFTNLSRDHLDYHGSMQSYGETKAQLVNQPGLKSIVYNNDDAWCRQLSARAAGVAELVSYSLQDPGADLFAAEITPTAAGQRFTLITAEGSEVIESGLFGRFNVENLLAVAGVLGAWGWSLSETGRALRAAEPPPGRMMHLPAHEAKPEVIVDYAHTPAALETVLKAIREHCNGTLWCLFGCGGERDQGKRAMMAAAVERYADRAVVTSDNPRGEDPERIIGHVMAGFQRPESVFVEPDRARAISWTVSHAADGDTILLAGKGHETYQENAAGKIHFNDVDQALAALAWAA